MSLDSEDEAESIVEIAVVEFLLLRHISKLALSHVVRVFALAIFFVVFVDDPDVLLPELASLQLFGRRAEAFAERFLESFPTPV